jgi:hypothetical protein
VFLTASTPRQITVETVELRSRTELLRLVVRSAAPSPGDDGDSLPDQFASISLSTPLDRGVGADIEMGIGKEAEGESLRISAACAWISSTPPKCKSERVGDGDGTRS